MRGKRGIMFEFARLWAMTLCAMLPLLLAAQTVPIVENEGLPDDGNPLRVEGTVRGPGGPAEGVRVLLELSDMRIRRQVAFLETKTDTEGHFTFDLRAHDLPEYGLQFNTVSRRFIETLRIVTARRAELPLTIDLDVTPGTVAQGTVTDEEGNPLGGVSITGTGIRTQESDSEGNWEVFGLPPFAEVRFRKEGYADFFLPVRTNTPQVVEGIEVMLESARLLSGNVVDWSDAPVPFAVVMLQAPGSYQRQSADKDGRFVFKGVPEDLSDVFIEVMAPGYLPTIHEFTEDEREKQEVRVVIDSGVFIKGKVALPSGTAAAGAEVTAGRTHHAGSPRSVADAEGNWKLGPFPTSEEITFTVLPPAMEGSWGIADLITQPKRNDPNELTGFVELWPKGFSSTFDIRRNADAITMTRRDEGPGGFPGEVRYTGTFTEETGTIEGTLEIPGMQQTGKFKMTMMVRRGQGLHGEWELREEIEPSTLAVAPGQITVRTPAITGTMIANLTLAEPQEISGEALRADGTPFIDGTVYLRDWNGTEVYHPEAKIEAGGRFRFERVPEGTFILQAVSSDREHGTEPMIVRGGIEGVQLLEAPEPDPIDE